MVGARRVGLVKEQEFQRQLDEMSRFIRRRAKCLVRRSVLFGYDDLMQECSMVLWRVLESYPDARGVELLKLFNRSMKNHFASLFRPDREWLKLDDKTDQFDPLASELNQVRLGIMKRHILPWDFFRYRLALIATKLDKEKYLRLCEIRGRANNVSLRKKEEELKEIL
jgi:DNA-directed RNA polymerase specialized sigma24 family protein